MLLFLLFIETRVDGPNNDRDQVEHVEQEQIIQDIDELVKSAQK